MAEEKKTKAELREIAETLTTQYNEAVQGGKYDIAAKLNDEIEQAVNEYTAIARDECFAECIASENPMMTAVVKLTFPTIRVTDKRVGDEKIPVREVADAERYIDLLKLHKAAGAIGANKDWFAYIEKLNFLLTAQKAVDLGIDPKTVNDSYAMGDIARAIDMGKTPTSKTNILKTLQSVVNAMIGDEYKATSHDVNFLMSVYSRKNRKALTVTCANHKYMRQYMAEICHRIVTGKAYEVEYKKAK